jgi:alpha-amylase
MPQSQLLFNDLARDTAAQAAIDAWLAGTAPATCAVTFVTNGPDWTFFGQDVWITGDLPELGSWNPTAGSMLGAPRWPMWEGTAQLPQGRTFEYKATVVDSFTGNVIWEQGANHQETVPTGSGCAVTFTTDFVN